MMYTCQAVDRLTLYGRGRDVADKFGLDVAVTDSILNDGCWEMFIVKRFENGGIARFKRITFSKSYFEHYNDWSVADANMYEAMLSVASKPLLAPLFDTRLTQEDAIRGWL